MTTKEIAYLKISALAVFQREVRQELQQELQYGKVLKLIQLNASSTKELLERRE